MMSLLPTPNPMSFISTGKILPITGLYGGQRHHHQQQHQYHQYLSNQPYLLLNADRSLYSNYYLVYVPLVGLPSTSILHPTSLLQASLSLLNSLLTVTPLLDNPLATHALLQKLSSISSLSPPSQPSSQYSSSSIAFVRQQYRYNMRPSYRYVPHLCKSVIIIPLFIFIICEHCARLVCALRNCTGSP